MLLHACAPCDRAFNTIKLHTGSWMVLGCHQQYTFAYKKHVLASCHTCAQAIVVLGLALCILLIALQIFGPAIDLSGSGRKREGEGEVELAGISGDDHRRGNNSNKIEQLSREGQGRGFVDREDTPCGIQSKWDYVCNYKHYFFNFLHLLVYFFCRWKVLLTAGSRKRRLGHKP